MIGNDVLDVGQLAVHARALVVSSRVRSLRRIEEGRVHRPGPHSVHRDAAWPQLLGRGAREMFHGRLDAGVGGIKPGECRQQRGHHGDNLPLAIIGNPLCGLADEEYAVLEFTANILSYSSSVVSTIGFLIHFDASGVDRDVDSPEVVDGLVEQPDDFGNLG